VSTLTRDYAKLRVTLWGTSSASQGRVLQPPPNLTPTNRLSRMHRSIQISSHQQSGLRMRQFFPGWLHLALVGLLLLQTLAYDPFQTDVDENFMANTTTRFHSRKSMSFAQVGALSS
jgi:hypothetical protein